ncbi:MAG TPA: alkaline phosphatase family protein [Candidatus Polarisedimenticolia bacterium]|jgi:tetratricopeptide (TPR) repeat protein|nr:alkaline phosphatase family protein [Candidatus Polarisedimenticolia bacterium]
MSRRFLPFVIIGILTLSLGVAWTTGRGIVRVPQEHFGVAGRRVLRPGIHLVSPFTPVAILSERGDGALPPLPVSSKEGIRGSVQLSFHFEVDPAALSTTAAKRHEGFHALLEEAASEALKRNLSGRSAAEFLDHASIEPPLSHSMTQALEAAGIRLSNLKWEVRLPSDFTRNLLRSDYAGRSRRTGVRLLVIGLDAADWEIIDPLVGAGRMPAMKRLVDSGVRAGMRSYNPMISPLLWTTVATGKGPDLHGVADFSVIEKATGNKVPIGSRYRKVKSLWNIASDLGRSAGIVAWWASYPADHLDGILVSDRVAALSMLPNREGLAGRPGHTYPPGYLKEILPKLALPRQVSLEEVRRFADVTPAEYQAGLDWIAHPPAAPKTKKENIPPQDPVGLLIKILTAARNYQAIALDLAGRRFDLTAVYFEGIDLVGHRFQHYLPPKMAMVSAEEFQKFHRVVTEYYVYQDELLGDLIRRAGPETTVMILSDHGFKAGARRMEGILPFTVDQPVEWHREEGIFVLSGPGAARRARQDSVTLFDVAPTVLALLGLPVPSDMPGAVLAEAIDPAFLAKFPPQHVPTYEGVGAPRETEEASGSSEEVSAEMMAQLRALGYVGGNDGNPESEPAKPGSEKSSPRVEAAPGTAASSAAAPEDTPVTYHRNMATYYLNQRDYPQAIAELLEANRREKLPKTYAMLAESYDALGRKQEARRALEQGWKEVPEGMGADSVLWYVQLSTELGDPAGGKAFLDDHRKGLKEAPAIRSAAEGQLAEAGGRAEEAQRLYWEALRADPTLVGAAKQLVGYLSREGRLEALRPTLEAGLRKSERIDEYHNLLGALDSEAGRKEEAYRHFRRAVELNPADARFSLNLGLTLMDLGRWDEAGAVLDKAAAASPNADLYLGLGNVRLRTGDTERALAAFQKAREIGGPVSARADLGIVLSYLRLKRSDDALAFARDSLARHPDNPPLQNLYQDLLRRR